MCSGVQELTDADLERLTVALANGLTVNPWYIAVSGNRCLESVSGEDVLELHAAVVDAFVCDVIGSHGAQLVVLGRVAHDLDEVALDGLGARLGDGGALVGRATLVAVVHADEGVAG